MDSVLDNAFAETWEDLRVFGSEEVPVAAPQ
jgi:hypothetical protein